MVYYQSVAYPHIANYQRRGFIMGATFDRMIILTEIITEENGRYAAHSKELGLATCGNTFEEARRRIEAATVLVLNTATKKGEIDALLREKRIRVYSKDEIRMPRRLSVPPRSWVSSHEHRVAVGVA